MPGLEGESERSLCQKTSEGSVAAFAVLIKRYWQPLVTYAARKLGNQDSGEDVAQEVFVRVWAKRRGLETSESLRGYLFRLAHNVVVDELRKREVRTKRPFEPEPFANAPPTPDQVTEANALADASAQAIRALPERRRDVFVLAHFHDLSYQEIADTLGITPRTVANHMSLALSDLREALEPLLDRKLGPR